MRIRESKGFIDSFEILPKNIKIKTIRALELLISNSRHPSLKLKKLKGYEDIWYGRIDKYYRFTFQIEGDVLIMRRFGAHNHIIKNP
jgi:mRNA interferase RelE/StbE